MVLAFAEMKGLVKDRLRRYGLYTQVGADRFFPTVGTAVDGYLRATGMEWTGRSGPTDPATVKPGSTLPRTTEARSKTTMGEELPG